MGVMSMIDVRFLYTLQSVYYLVKNAIFCFKTMISHSNSAYLFFAFILVHPLNLYWILPLPLPLSYKIVCGGYVPLNG